MADDKALDYRTSSWSLREALASDDALARLEARPVKPTGQDALAALRIVVDSTTPRRTGDELLARGCRHLGAKHESAGFRPKPSLDVFVDADETTYITIRSKPSLMGLSRYYILTYFDDGTCIETVARHNPLTPSSERHICRGGHDDDVVLDLSEHLEFVREHVRERGVRIVPVRDLDTVNRLAKYFYGHVASAEIASNVAAMKQREISIALMALCMLLMIAWAIARSLGR